MKNFITILLINLLVACVTTHQVHVPVGGYSIDVVEGDDVSIVMNDGSKHSFRVTHIDTTGLAGSEGSFAYSEMQSVQVKRTKRPPKTLWLLLLSLAVVAVFAESDDHGSGLLCLYSSNDPSRRCL